MWGCSVTGVRCDGVWCDGVWCDGVRCGGSPTRGRRGLHGSSQTFHSFHRTRVQEVPLNPGVVPCHEGRGPGSVSLLCGRVRSGWEGGRWCPLTRKFRFRGRRPLSRGLCHWTLIGSPTWDRGKCHLWRTRFRGLVQDVLSRARSCFRTVRPDVPYPSTPEDLGAVSRSFWSRWTGWVDGRVPSSLVSGIGCDPWRCRTGRSRPDRVVAASGATHFGSARVLLSCSRGSLSGSSAMDRGREVGVDPRVSDTPSPRTSRRPAPRATHTPGGAGHFVPTHSTVGRGSRGGTGWRGRGGTGATEGRTPRSTASSPDTGRGSGPSGTAFTGTGRRSP